VVDKTLTDLCAGMCQFRSNEQSQNNARNQRAWLIKYMRKSMMNDGGIPDNKRTVGLLAGSPSNAA
jgi:hypothetical protein